MRIRISEQEYLIKAKQAIEILDLVEQSGLLKQLKDLKFDSLESLSDIGTILPVSYKLAHKVLAIATGTFEGGKMIPNEDLVDNLNAIDLPMLALQIVKTLMFPIQYAISDDPGILEEKKESAPTEDATNPGKSEKSAATKES